MGVYIKGMEMPTSCVDCRFHKSIYCTLTDICTNTAQGCPLVPVPPHGRLIDVKSLENMHFTESMYDVESKLFVPFVEVASAIFDAPTIIPASDKDINVLCKEEGET